MALEVETGQFSADATDVNNATDVISVGFDPKALIIWGYHDITSNGTTQFTAVTCLGFCDDADNNRCTGGQSENDVSNADCRGWQFNNRVIVFTNLTAQQIDRQGSCTLGTGDFTITWNLNDNVADLINWIAFGGSDITGVQALSFPEPAADGVQNVPTNTDVQGALSNQAMVLMIGTGATQENSILNNTECSYGFATAPATDSGFNIQYAGDDNSTSSEARMVLSETRFTHSINALTGAQKDKGYLNAFTGAGFDITWDSVTTPLSQRYYLIIKGGQWEAGVDVAKITTTGTKDTTTTFLPKGLIIFNTIQTAVGISNPFTPDFTDCGWNWGATDATTDVCAGHSDEIATQTVIGVHQRNTKCVVHHDPVTPTSVFAEADLDSFNALNFRLDWTTVDSTARKFIWLVAGDAAAVTARPFSRINVNASGMI